MTKKMSTEEIIERLEVNHNNYLILYRWLENFDGDSGRISRYLLQNIDTLKSSIPTLTRAGECCKSKYGWKYLKYRDNCRNGKPRNAKDDEIYVKTGKHRRAEDYLAMSIYLRGRDNAGNCMPINGLGYILDYQTPIGGTSTLLQIQEGETYYKNDSSYPFGIIDPDKELDNSLSKKKQLFNPGKCDLIAYDDNCFTIIELKVEGNTESMLRAVMEAYTYRKMINHTRAAESFKACYNYPEISLNARWNAAVLLYKGGSQYVEYERDSNLRELVDKLDIRTIWYTQGFSIMS